MARLISSSPSTSTSVSIASVSFPFKTTKTKHGLTLKSSHQQLSNHLALNPHRLNEFILRVLLAVENSNVNSYAMGLVATQRPKTSVFTLSVSVNDYVYCCMWGTSGHCLLEQHCSVQRKS